jgi:hypothetical protein
MIRHCLCIRSACEWDGSAAATQTESDSARAELMRESRDSANDCQSRELRSHPTHAGVVTICTVPEMLPETWTRGNDVRQDGFVLLSCHFSQRLSIRTRTPPCPSPSPSSPPCASPPSRSRPDDHPRRGLLQGWRGKWSRLWQRRVIHGLTPVCSQEGGRAFGNDAFGMVAKNANYGLFAAAISKVSPPILRYIAPPTQRRARRFPRSHICSRDRSPIGFPGSSTRFGKRDARRDRPFAPAASPDLPRYHPERGHDTAASRH